MLSCRVWAFQIARMLLGTRQGGGGGGDGEKEEEFHKHFFTTPLYFDTSTIKKENISNYQINV